MTKVNLLTLKTTILGFLTETNRTVHLVPLMQAVLHRSELAYQECAGIFSLPLPLTVSLWHCRPGADSKAETGQ